MLGGKKLLGKDVSVKEVTFDREMEHKKDVSEAMILANDGKKDDGEVFDHEEFKERDISESTFPLDENKKVTKQQVCIEQVIQKR